ncbi:MAG: DUF455 family protein [Planctomycetes bacterium]|nr:DUF455 family protein [Planctomycetota bacterium]
MNTMLPAREGTVEAWALALVLERDAARKLAPGAAPEVRDEESWCEDGVERRVEAPGRPGGWSVTRRAEKAAKTGALGRVEERVRMLHVFAHHELQAAELFAWALLAFPQTPRAFRAGLVALCGEELRHLASYVRRIEELGGQFGMHPLRDWFWERVGSVRTPLEFVALQGVGLEGANLEHAARWARLFRAAGDETSAQLIDVVEREEIGHVAFARTWFERLSGASLTYERWAAALPPPLTPALFHGAQLNLEARRRAGLDEAFLAALQRAGPAVRERAAP